MPEPRGTAILIHGAWQGAWVWDSQTEPLREAGWRPVALDLPGNGADGRKPSEVTFEDHVDHASRAIDAAGDGPVVLIAHSGGGVLATALAERHAERIAGLVYVCGMMLPSGVTFPEFVAPFAAQDPRAHGIVPHLRSCEDGTSVPADAACEIFYQDVPPETARAAAARLSVQGPAVRAPRVDYSESRGGRVPRRYIRCGADRSVLPQVQDAMCATRPGAQVVRMESGHAPMLAAPEDLARVLSALLAAL